MREGLAFARQRSQHCQVEETTFRSPETTLSSAKENVRRTKRENMCDDRTQARSPRQLLDSRVVTELFAQYVPERCLITKLLIILTCYLRMIILDFVVINIIYYK